MKGLVVAMASAWLATVVLSVTSVVLSLNGY